MEKEEKCNCGNKCDCQDKKLKKDKKNEINNLLEKMSLLEEEALRAKADLINYRKRKDEEVSQLLRYCNEDVLLSLLTVVDNFERALSINDNKQSEELVQFLNGFKIIYVHLKDLLDKNDVKEIDCLNKKFDSNVHQALLTDNDSNYEDDIITEVLMKGYTYKDKVLRYASVKVNKKEIV